MKTRSPNARDRALTALLLVDAGEGFAADQLDQLQKEEHLSPADVGLAHEIALGTLRHRLTLSHVAGAFLRVRVAQLAPPIRWILAMAVYQLCWLDRVPAFAAVDTAVEQAKTIAGKRAGGLVNAVLRSLLRSRGDRVRRPANIDPRHWLATDVERGFEFKNAILPDPQSHPLEFLSLTTSTPAWLVRRWQNRFDEKTAARICRMNAERPAVVLRVNTQRIRPADLLRRFAKSGISARLDPRVPAIEVALDHSITKLVEFQQGLCQPQDATAQSVWLARPPKPSELVVDLCAGAGTKATHAAELMSDRGIVIASDTNLHRLRLAADNAARLQLTSIMCIPAEALENQLRTLASPPNVILIDAPCSNSGTLARRPEARYRLNANVLRKLAAIQRRLLDHASRLAGPHTDILYATCSIEPEENEEVVTSFCKQSHGWRLESSQLTLPDPGDTKRVWRDGGFVALLRRSP